jgi:hypothetical protein
MAFTEPHSSVDLVRTVRCEREAAMNVQLPLHMEKEAFLAWAEGREGRYELDCGRVIMMTGDQGHTGASRSTF